ncbi:hypothetical protein [Knoellia flava]|uniref:hypothetical protein n=1 Tax=Knoellia flava TaxID=913969 RepID=UPI0012EB117C|nr:hypothetical protein [Knoellia flava]
MAVWNDEGTWVVILVVASCIGWVVRTFERRVALGWRRVHAAGLMVVAIVVADYAYFAFFDGEGFVPAGAPLADFVDWELELLSSPPVLGAVMWLLPVGLAVLGVLRVDDGEEEEAAPARDPLGLRLPAAQVVSIDRRGGGLETCAIHVVFERSPDQFVHRTVVCRPGDVEALTPFLVDTPVLALESAVPHPAEVSDRSAQTAAEAFDDAYGARPPARLRQWLFQDEIAELSSSPALWAHRSAQWRRGQEREDGR